MAPIHVIARKKALSSDMAISCFRTARSPCRFAPRGDRNGRFPLRLKMGTGWNGPDYFVFRFEAFNHAAYNQLENDYLACHAQDPTPWFA
jgi:hypothetical protein